MQGALLEGHLAYWRERLADVPLLELPTDRPRPPAQSYRGAEERIALPAALADGVRALARRSAVTPFMTLLAALNVLLHRYSGQEDIVVGMPIANRTQEELEGLIGFFANTLALRTDLSGDPTFSELLMRVRDVALEAYSHQDLPFEKLVAELQPARSLSYSPIFQVAFAFQNAPRSRFELPGLEVSRYRIESGTAKFDLTLSLNDVPGAMTGNLEYAVDLFDPATARRMVGHFATLLEAAAADPARPISRLPMLPEEERRLVTVEWARNPAPYPADACIHGLFEEQARRTPQAVALVMGERALTYAELDARADALAGRLSSLGVRPGSIVGIHSIRTPEMVIGMLAVLKAGGAYMPLNPSYPAARREFMVRDAGARVVLAQGDPPAELAALGVEVVRLDEDEAAPAGGGPCAARAEAETSPDDLAYVMYTSGSTGMPKGVEVPHRAVVRVAIGAGYCRLDANQRILHMGDISFDVSTFEVWAPLLHGGRCVLMPDRMPTIDSIRRALRENEVNTLWLTSALFNAVIDEAPEILSNVEQLLTGGEALSVRHVRRAQQLLPQTRLINGYGPTEATVFATSNALDEPLPEDAPSVPIGRPIGNTTVYVLDEHLEPVPTGVPGELHIGGPGLARGYLNRPELTARKFIPDPFGDDPADRLYKTGDRVRFLPDGKIEFLGRFDDQAKIRGFRVEPGETAAVLRSAEAVRDAAAIVREDEPGEKCLVAYVVLHEGRSATPAELREHLAARMPEFMVPSAIVIMDALPLNARGKLDRRALPAPEGGTGGAHVAPRDMLERQLAELWQGVLGVESVGVTDSFFDLGGHSLLAVRLFTRIEKVFGQKLPLATLFKSPTVEGLAGVLRQQGWSQKWTPIVPVQTTGSRAPFFCVAAMDAFAYVHLARLLPRDQPFYVLHPLGLVDLDDPQIDIPALAAQYLERVRQVQAEGPYLLGGMCSGGVVAYEMAQRLTAEGEQVAMLALIDSPLPSPGSRLDALYRFVTRSGHHLRGLLRTPRGQRMDYLRARLESLRRRRQEEAVPLAELPAETALVEEYWGPIRSAYMRTLPAYVPEPYAGRIVMFLGRETSMGRIRDPRRAWRRLAAGGAELHVVPGDHTNMLREPHVRVLAKELGRCLDAAAGGDD